MAASFAAAFYTWSQRAGLRKSGLPNINIIMNWIVPDETRLLLPPWPPLVWLQQSQQSASFFATLERRRLETFPRHLFLSFFFLNRCLSLQRILLNSTRIKFRSKNKIRFGRCRKNYGGPRLGKVSTPTPREPCPRGNWGQLTAGVNEKSEQESCGGCSKVLDYGSEFRSRAVVVAQ